LKNYDKINVFNVNEGVDCVIVWYYSHRETAIGFNY